MKKQTISSVDARSIFLATTILICSATAYAADINSTGEPKKQTAKRVWTNDDFQPADPGPAIEQSNPKPATSAKPAVELAISQQSEENPDLVKARKEVVDEMITTAKAREKAYDDTISDVKAKLETETNEFRIEVYNNILRDTAALKAVNKRALEQFGVKSEPKPETENNRPEEVK